MKCKDAVKRNLVVCLLVFIYACVFSSCGKEKTVEFSDQYDTRTKYDEQIESGNQIENGFLGIWQKENSHISLYVVGDGKIYMGDLGHPEEDDELMYESSYIFTGTINGKTLEIMSFEDKYDERHSFEKKGDVLIDEKGETWKYIKRSARLVKDEGIY